MKNLFLFLLKIYKNFFSPIISNRGVHCKYYPTCSEYSRQAITKYGAIKGGVLSIRRFCKCNPFSKGGYDPVK